MGPTLSSDRLVPAQLTRRAQKPGCAFADVVLDGEVLVDEYDVLLVRSLEVAHGCT
jgi:hypothetical protein